MENNLSPEISYGHLLRLHSPVTGKPRYNFQNFALTKEITHQNTAYGFAPFGFSGVTVNKSGDNQLTQIALPPDNLSKQIAIYLSSGDWVANIDMLIINPGNVTDFAVLSSFAGQVSGLLWSETDLRLEVSSVIDAVGNDVPRRRITEDIFGPLPSTSNLRFS